jgi:hypothetical protein
LLYSALILACYKQKRSLSSDSLVKVPGCIFLHPGTVFFNSAFRNPERKDIDSVKNTIVGGGDTLRSVSKERSWGPDSKLFVHVFYNDMKAAAVKNNLYGHVRQLVQATEIDSSNGKLKEQFDHYLIIRKSEKQENGFTVSVRDS